MSLVNVRHNSSTRNYQSKKKRERKRKKFSPLWLPGQTARRLRFFFSISEVRAKKAPIEITNLRPSQCLPSNYCHFPRSIGFPTESEFLCSIIYRTRLASLKLPKGQSAYTKCLVRGDKHERTMCTEKRAGEVAETYVVAAVAGEGEEVDLPALADAAVLPQVGELRRAHPAGKGTSARVEGPEPAPPRDFAVPGGQRRGQGRTGEGNRTGGRRGSVVGRKRSNKRNALTVGPGFCCKALEFLPVGFQVLLGLWARD